MTRIRVWDAPTRIGHWLLATAFVVAWVTAEREAWRLVHVKAGYVMLGVLAFRLLWGAIGSRHARFAAFLYSPRAVLRYLGTLLRGRPEHYAGHNPAGAVAIFVLLALGIAVTVTGVAVYEDWGGERIANWHDGLADAMLATVVVHLAGVLAGSLLHRENLALAMVTGDKRGSAGEAILPGAGAWGCVALAGVVAFALWW